MGYIDDASGKREMQEMRREIRALQTSSPLGNSSVTEGRLRIASNEGLLVEGSAVVSGTQSISGVSNIGGTQNVSGTQTVTGTSNLNGPTHIAGNTDISGTLAVNGATTVTGNMTVNGGGTITVGGMVLDPSVSGFGGIRSGGTIYLSAPGVLTTGQVSAGSVYIVGSSLTVTSIGTTTSPANVFIDGLGVFKKVTSAARFKIDPQPMDLPDSLLAVPVKDWIDTGAHERGEDPVRVPGVIAEEVLAAGGSQFVGYSAEGEIESVAYDRLALARTEILARQLAEALEQIADLRAQLSV